MGPGLGYYVGFALRYAFRNLGRNRRRTALTMATVLFSVALAIIANRYTTALMQLWEDGAADTGTAHAQLHAQGYWQKQEGVDERLTMAEGNPVEQSVRTSPDVESSVRRLAVEGLVSTGDESIYFVGKGVEPANEMATSPRLFSARDQGHWINDGEPSGIVVGKGLAQSLKVKLGDEVTLITQTVQGSVNGIDARIVGIVDAAIPSFSQRSVYAPLPLLQKLIRMPGRYTELAVRLRPGVDATAWVDARRAAAEAEGQELRGWWDIEPLIRNIGLIWHSIFVVVTALLFLSATLGVLNIIFMMVNERTVEIGTLMAIGARPFDVRLLFSLESVLIGLVGGGIGALLGNLAVAAMDEIGVPFESPFGSDVIVVHPKMHLGITLVVFLLGVLTCYVSALAPSRKASLVEPVRAFRGQIT